MPKQVEVTAEAKLADGSTKSETIFIAFGETATESIEMFGDEAVNSNACRNGKITVQSGMRKMIKDGKTQEQIQNKYKNWKLGVTMERVTDPVGALMAKWDNYSPEEQADILKQLKSKK
jgi:hypothetical protein